MDQGERSGRVTQHPFHHVGLGGLQSSMRRTRPSWKQPPGVERTSRRPDGLLPSTQKSKHDDRAHDEQCRPGVSEEVIREFVKEHVTSGSSNLNRGDCASP